MKKCHRSILALLLSLALVVACVTPVKASEAQPQKAAWAPMTTYLLPQKLLVPGGRPGDTLDYVTTTEEAIAILRQGFRERRSEISIPITTVGIDDQLIYDVFYGALEHTGEPTEGDYLLWHLGNVGLGRSSAYGVGEQWYYSLIYQPEYYTTNQQENQMDQAVDTLLDQLDVYDASDYEKVCAIYDYMCNHITYDYAGLDRGTSDLIYTAYAALINGTAVCQGYANLFYRLALELDVDARLISGIGNGGPHGWNIVALGNRYYNLDATWDTNYASAGMDYEYFLRCEANFDDHYRDAEYDTDEFHAAYPMATEDYDPGSTVVPGVPGDIDGNSIVDSEDLISLLLYVSMPDLFPISADADFDGNHCIDAEDLIRLLLYVSMPDLFPLKG